MGTRKNVLFFPAWYPGRGNPFAVPFLREHARAVSLCHDVVVLCAPREASPCASSYRVERSREDGIAVVRVSYRRSPVPKTTLMLYLYAVIATTLQIIRSGFRPDLIHAHFYSAGLASVILGKLLRIPVVLTENSASFAMGLNGRSLREAKLALARMDMLIPVSQSLRAQMEAHGIRGIFRVIPNPVDTAIFRPPQIPANPVERPCRLLFVARLDPIKDVPTLLHGLALLKGETQDFILDILGDGPQRQEYQALASRLGLDNHVAFHGFQPPRVVAEFMRRAHVFALSSLSENCPCVLLEAQATGLPVVSSDVGGVREVVPDGMGAFFRRGDPAGLAGALSSVLRNLPSYDRSAIASRAQARFSLEAVGRQIDEVYRFVIDRRR